MHLKSITLDGFKSYGQRTVISGFDPYFNAITGLNGSGKSNILDSICFLLGITNLSQVRASNLQELVYKNGQAGITKASVSITFDNQDKGQSPVGYDQYDEITVTRQIVMGGQNKYMINGCTATNARVKDLFQSVQLNVNNPHFLIMQGRITKVLNMKPIEILSMIEEAAGTKMYEAKKQASQRTMGTKEAKLKEINSILDEDITPTLTKLKDERAAFLEYQKIQRELEHLTKLNVASQYVAAQNVGQKSKEELVRLKDTTQQLQMKIDALKDQGKELEKIISETQKKRANEATEELVRLESELSNREKSEAKTATSIKNKKDNLNAETKKIANVNKQKTEDSKSATSKEKGLEKLTSELAKLRESGVKDAEAVAAAENRFQAVSSGLSNNADGQEATLADQLITAKAEIATAETAMKQAEMTLKHSSSELQTKEVGILETKNVYEKDQATLEPLRKAIEKIENDMRNLRYEEGKLEQLTERQRNLQRHVNGSKDRYDTLCSKFPQLSFNYTNPTPNFDRGKVKGLLCDLFTLQDPAMATALEVVAGGKLYNVVVDNEETGKLLLQKGNLTRRHTIIPLNKIQGQPITAQVLKRAEELVGRDNVCTALSLITYEPHLKPAMEFAFGNVLICKDAALAQTVAFDKRILKRTITVDGDVYNPAGTLTGGSRKPGKPFLAMLAEIKQVKVELNHLRAELMDVTKQLENIDAVAKKFNDLRQEWDMKKREAELLNERLRHTVHHQRLEEVDSLRKTIEEQKETVKRSKDSISKASKKVKELEDKIKNFQSVRENELKEAEKHMNECKKQAEASGQLMKDKEQEVDVLKLELEDLAKGVGNYDEQVKAIEDVIAEIEEQMKQLTELQDEEKASIKVAREAVAEQKKMLKAREAEINSLQEQHDVIKKEIEDSGLLIKEGQNEVAKWKGQSTDAANKMEDLLANYDWINEEKKYFGKSGTMYDFDVNDPREARQRLQKLNEKKEQLSKNINTRAMSMLDRTEEQYNDLVKKKEIVKKDKLTITAVIKELDEKKNEALQTAWVKVNQDFGSIFSTLLPGTQAKLIPLEGKTVLDGLEVKVAFGNKWKESLSELSGGQRSLVALSLILSLLLFKPAPIYILDEVDAALDLSHTQNIGNMLRTHFMHSQFIVVSLKDGMFNNANVLFKTKFVDGMSVVTRHSQSQAHHAKKP